MLLFPVAERLSLVIENIRLIQSAISIQSAYIQVLLKIIGITYISEFAADICRDAGCAAVAGQIGVFCEAVHSGGQHAYRERAASDDTELPGRVSMDTFTLEQLDFSEIQRPWTRS